MNATFNLKPRTQILKVDAAGRNFWQANEAPVVIPAREILALVCDMWNAHPCRAAAERVNKIAPRMDAVLKIMRAKGALIVHAPSNLADSPQYAETSARLRMLNAPRGQPPPMRKHANPPLPVDMEDASDSPAVDQTCALAPYACQHPAIEIDQERDGISESGVEVLNIMRQRGLNYYIIMGVHTGMCILGRTFGIRDMVRRGVNTMLVRDLTDTLYNPARPPYVSHDEGTRLTVDYIEKFWCPTISSDELTREA